MSPHVPSRPSRPSRPLTGATSVSVAARTPWRTPALPQHARTHARTHTQLDVNSMLARLPALHPRAATPSVWSPHRSRPSQPSQPGVRSRVAEPRPRTPLHRLYTAFTPILAPPGLHRHPPIVRQNRSPGRFTPTRAGLHRHAQVYTDTCRFTPTRAGLHRHVQAYTGTALRRHAGVTRPARLASRAAGHVPSDSHHVPSY